MAFTPDINYGAVFAAAGAGFVVSMLWYTVLFGKYWAAKEGVSMDQKPGAGSMAYMMGLEAVGKIAMAYVFVHVIEAFWAAGEDVGVPTALMGAVWMWLGFVFPMTIGKATWEGKGWGLWAVNAGGWLVVLLAMAAILGAWT